ncbi:MAG: hypothetical protein ACYTGH_04880, partial [Planctomycetota bacterium]
ILNVGAGQTLSLHDDSAVAGTLTVKAGGTLKLANNRALTCDSTSTFTVENGSTITNAGAGTYAIAASGHVTMAGSSGSPITMSYGTLTLGASGKTAIADGVRMSAIGTGGTYLTITGDAWHGYKFKYWGFATVSGATTVNMNAGSTVKATMANYETSAGNLYGEGSDADTSGILSWSPTSAMSAVFAGTSAAGEPVSLEWETVSEVCNAGFKIYRTVPRLPSLPASREVGGRWFARWFMKRGLRVSPSRIIVGRMKPPRPVPLMPMPSWRSMLVGIPTSCSVRWW